MEGLFTWGVGPEARHIHCVDAWNDEKQVTTPILLGGVGRNWVAEGRNPNPKGGLYPNQHPRPVTLCRAQSCETIDDSRQRLKLACFTVPWRKTSAC